MCNQWKKLYQLKHQYLIRRMKYLTLLSSGLFQHIIFFYWPLYFSNFQILLLSVEGELIVRQNKLYLPSFCELLCSVMEEFSDNALIN